MTKTLRDHINETETWIDSPAVGDNFAINIREECLVESHIVDVVEDGVVLAADDKMIQILESYGLLETADPYRREVSPPSAEEFEEGFPYDVDHMKGAVIRNADMITDNVKTKDKAEWDRATNSINARVFDDMSEFRTNSKGETVVGDSAVWAKWDNATQTGWFNAKGRPLKPWPVKEQGVAEGSTKAAMAEATIMKNILGGRWFDDYHEIPGYWDQGRSGNYVWTELDLESFGFEYTGPIGGLKYLGIKSLKRPTKQEIRQWLNARIKMLARNGFKPIQQGVAEDSGELDRILELAGMPPMSMPAVTEGGVKNWVDDLYYEFNEKYDLPRDIDDDRYLSMVDKFLQQQGVDPDKIEDIGELFIDMRDHAEDNDHDYANQLDAEQYDDEDMMDEAKYQGREVSLGKPFLTPAGPKKRSVYVKNPKGNVVKVNFGDKKLRIKKSNPKRRKSFRARHNCANPGPRHKARFWSCRAW